MLQKKVYFKSDFKIFLESEAGWTGLPFRLKFYTGAPNRAFVACFDGTEYHNCHLHEDGRLCVAFDNHNFGFGTLRMEPTFYLNDACYRDGICDEAIPPFDVVLKDEPTEEVPDPEEYTIVLAMDGVKTLETIGTLPAFYQKGDKGEPGLTPAEHDALVQATADANAAADRANGVIDDAEAAARLATAAAINADNKAAAAAEAARLADAARQQLTTTFNEKVAALEADYAQKTAALDADYESVKQSLSADYAAKKASLDADYASAKSALSTAYAEAIASLNNRMSAIETQYATDKVEWQRQVNAILAKFEQDFATAEAAREERVALAIAHADTAAGNANAAATQAGNVNAVLDGDELTVTDRNGQSVTRNVRGPQGEPGASVTFFPAVTIFGQPHIEGPQISGFSANDYMQFPFVVNFAGRPWELHFDIATGADVSNQHNIFDSQFGLAFAFANGHFVMALSSNGTSWDLGAPEGTHAILPNQTYHIRMSWDGSVYKLEFSTDEVTWTTDITVASTASLYPRQIVIGKDIFTGTHFYNGSINFAHAQLTIAGVVVWEGMEEIGVATRMAIDMSNIDEAGMRKVNEVAMDGEVGQKIGELSSQMDNKANTDGFYSRMGVGIAKELLPSGDAIEGTFVSRKTAGGASQQGTAKIDNIKGNSVVWNQKVNVSSLIERTSFGITYTPNENGEISATGTASGSSLYSFGYKYITGHIYAIKGCPSGGSTSTYRINCYFDSELGNGVIINANTDVPSNYPAFQVFAGNEVNNLVFKPQIFDLTQMFGSGNEPTTYEEFLLRKPQVADEYAYNEGEVVNMTANKIVSKGRNLWDEDWEQGRYDDNGKPSYSNIHIRSKLISCTPNTAYFFTHPNTRIRIHFYDKDKNHIEYITTNTANAQFTTPIGAYYLSFWTYTDGYGGTYKNDICLNFPDPSFNGQYEPYKEAECDLSLVQKYFPNGMAKIGSVVDELDFINKVAHGRIGVRVLDGTENFVYFEQNDYFYCSNLTFVEPTTTITPASIVMGGYNTIGYSVNFSENNPSIDNAICVYRNLFRIKDTSCNGDVLKLKDKLNGKILFFELATPTDTPITEDVPTYEAFDGGSETIESESSTAPITMSAVYNLDVVATLKKMLAYFTKNNIVL